MSAPREKQAQGTVLASFDTLRSPLFTDEPLSGKNSEQFAMTFMTVILTSLI